MIIEKVSGVSYEQFIQENIFRPLGMHHSYYMSNEPIIPKRASGYASTEQGFRNADYLSMTQPFSAQKKRVNFNNLRSKARWLR